MSIALRVLIRWIPRSARSRLALLFGALAVMVAVPGVLYVNYVFSERLLQDRQASLQDLAQAAAVVLSENLRERQQEIDYLAATREFRAGPLESRGLTQSLETLKKSHTYYTWIGLADDQGQVRAATGDMLVGVSVAQRPWFANGRNGRFVGDLHEAVLLAPLVPKVGDGPVRFIDFAAPVISEDGQFRGVLGAHAHWTWARQVMAAVLPLNTDERGVEVMIANRNGEVLFPDRRAPERLPISPDLKQPRQLKGPSGTLGDFVFASAAILEVTPGTPLNWTIVVRQPLQVALREVSAIRQVLMLSALLCAVFFVSLAWWVASRVTKPIHQLALVARRIERGEEDARLDVQTQSRELRELVRALGGMASTLMRRRDELAQSNALLEQRVQERTESLHKLNQELHLQARTDPLTGLANRLAANERLRDEFMRMRRTGMVFSVLVVDADHFKRINDTLGHAVGDEVLKHLSQVLRESVRQTDVVARMGGEEFLVLLPDTAANGALEVARKLCEAVREAPAPDGTPKVTVSVGVAQADPGHQDPDEVLREADRWLYAAKDAGRNRVAHAPVAKPGDELSPVQ